MLTKEQKSNCNTMKVIEFIKKNCMWFIAVLLLLLGVKSCQSCSRTQKAAFAGKAAIATMDSLKSEIQKRDDTIYLLNDSISVLNTKLNAAEAVIERLDKDKSDYKRISEHLAKRPVQTTISK